MLTLAGGPPPSRPLLERMNEVIRHRGPDSGGFLVDGPVGLGMRRLSILDLEGGRQPIANEDSTIHVTFNGEIYNYRALRAELEGMGHRFRTQSDTETIVHAYEAWGDQAVTHLRGMFTIALWDSRTQRLLLARDRAGIKQLFWTVVGDRLLWGSEIKCLLQHEEVARETEPQAVHDFLAFGYVPGQETIFRGIQELEPAHMMVAGNGQAGLPQQYWELNYRPDRSRSLESTTEAFREKLEEAVRLRMVADVPLGAFLSGGIDSGTIVALMTRNASGPVKTFSIGYEDAGEAFDERDAARSVAEMYGSEHHEQVVKPDLEGIASRLVCAYDHPFADASALPNWYLAETTRKHVTVALSGLGGDELLGGYERYRGALLAERARFIPEVLRRNMIQPLVERLPDAHSGLQWVDRAKRFVRSMQLPFDRRYFSWTQMTDAARRSELLHPDLKAKIDRDRPWALWSSVLAHVADAEPLDRALYADLKFYLPGDLLTLADRMSMAHSLEVRIPFLDHELLEFAATVPPEWKVRGAEKKYLLRRVARDLLPAPILDRRKMGFSVPLAVWFRHDLRDWIEDLLSRDSLDRLGWFDPKGVRRCLDEHLARTANHDGLIWALATCVLWDRKVRRAPRVHEVAE
jgi:asparagine synthase (glutamine-hydrolysing)